MPTTLRRFGGSTVVTILPAMLDLLKCRAGDSVDFFLMIELKSVRPKKSKCR